MSAAIPAPPLPPFLPENLEQFAESLPARTQEWYAYASAVYQYIENSRTALVDANEKALQSNLQNQALRRELDHTKQQLDHAKHESERQLDRSKATHDYQDEQLQRMTMKLVEALKERDQAISLATPTVNIALTPNSGSRAEEVAAPATRTSALAPAPASESSRISERLPDPEKFEGVRKDLPRFTSQVQEKLTVNRDRFPSPQSRMAYVTSRLRGDPYAQVLPHIREGICQLKDYNEILDLLDRAFGDPNRINNARKSLFRLRQSNKDFSTFFAEFQRLALEGNMPEESLPTLLEEAISRELKGMLLHHEPPNKEYHPLAQFLQSLENRLHQYESAPPAQKTYAAATKPRPVFPVPSPAIPMLAIPTVSPATAGMKTRDPDAMDLGYQQRRPAPPTTRRDRGECFRCGSSAHRIRDCPLPDTRGPRTMGPVRGRSNSPRSEGSPRGSPFPSPDLSNSINGMSLD